MLIARIAILLPFAVASLSVPTGLINSASTCFLNSLLACFYELPNFRQAVYFNYSENDMMSAIAGVFARKQLNNLPALDIRHEMLRALHENSDGRIVIGRYQDIDELFRFLFTFFPAEVADSIGISYSERLMTASMDYLINQKPEKREPFLMLYLPQESKVHNLQDLVDSQLLTERESDFTLHPEDHLEYMLQQRIPLKSHVIKTITTTRITHIADILPIFIARGRLDEVSRKDEVEVEEYLQLAGAQTPYILVGFSVYHGRHYYSYVRSAKDLKWYRHDDDEVKEVTYAKFKKDLRTRAVLLFFAKIYRTPEPEIPHALRYYAEEANKLQHMKDKFSKYMKKSK